MSATFHLDPVSLREVADSEQEATEHADRLLARYRAQATNPAEQRAIAPELIQWLRISGQTGRAEEVARTAFARVGPSGGLDLLEDPEPSSLSFEQISPGLRLATAMQWNSEPGEERFGQARALFDLCVSSAQALAFGVPPVDPAAALLLAIILQHRGKMRLASHDIFGALRDINLALTYRLQFGAAKDQLESSEFAVAALISQLEAAIEERNLASGASIETETFAAGDRSGFGAVEGTHRTGPWLFWLRTGRLKAFGSYHADMLEGPWYWFREQGSLLQEGAFVANQQHGPWTRYYANGNRLDQGSFDHGVKTGVWTSFNEDGTVKATVKKKAIKAPEPKTKLGQIASALRRT